MVSGAIVSPVASVHVIVYGATPPLIKSPAVPSHDPKQALSVVLIDTSRTGGSARSMVMVVSQPLPSVTTQIHWPAQALRAELPPCPFEGTGVHSYVNVPTPPCGVITMVPSQAPLQLTGITSAVAVSCGGPRMRTGTTTLHPESSVMVTWAGPAQRPSASGPPWPLDGTGSHT